MSDPAERWQRVKRLFNEAIELPEAERSAYLSQACGNDPSLHDEVVTLLANEPSLDDFLEEPFFSLHTHPDPDLGSQLGPYRLVRRLGSGGMGAVYLAKRADGELEQKVAIKLLKRGIDTEEILRRFQMERQILADLSHLYIARLLDVGTAQDGRPYFALEHVEGERIDRWCDARRLGIRDRVALIRRVCEAVHFAHQNLVVHRDLKPANILVTSTGTPKLLDFGIAKLLEREARFTDALTRPGPAPMSLPYASPEQLAGGAITTTSDVYALGVVLYELLTGHRPYHLDDLGLEEAARRLREDKLTKPSAMVEHHVSASHPGDGRPTTPQSIAADRASDPRRLTRRLRGDLDNIILKALAAEPERRYASAEQLSEDLRRYLEGLPVEARPDTFFYRGGKFVRRHPIGVGATILVVCLIVTLVTAFGLAITKARARAEQERDVANQVKDFLVHLPDYIDPNRQPGQGLTLREALDAGVQHLERELEDEPLLRAELLDAIGSSYRRLAEYTAARQCLEEVLKLRRSLYGRNHVLVAESMHNLANVLDDDQRTEELMRDAVKIQRQHFPDGHLDLARGLNNLAIHLLSQGKIEEAEATAQEALAMAKGIFGPEHSEVTGPLNTLANIFSSRGDLREAERYQRRCLVLRREHEAPLSPELTNTLSGLAGTLTNQGRHEEAAPFYEEALAIRRKLYPGDHPSLVTIFNNTGRHLLFRGQTVRASELLQEAFDMQLRLDPEWGRRTAILARSLAWARGGLGEAAVCEDLSRTALEHLRPGSKLFHETRSILGGCLAALGRAKEAEPLLRQGHHGLLNTRGAEDPVTKVAHRRLEASFPEQ